MDNKLPAAVFREVVRSAPLIAIDICLVTAAQKILLGYRNNRPARDTWFVPGGRIQKGESLATAFRRISLQELGSTLTIDKSIFLGVYEHFYADNVFDEHFGTHYVVLTYANFDEIYCLEKLPREQHARYWLASFAEFQFDPTIHENSRAYAPALASAFLLHRSSKIEAQ